MARIEHSAYSSPPLRVARLGDTVGRLWREGIENPEVCDLLLQIVGAGKLTACADFAYEAAMDGARVAHERSVAINALLQLNDPRLETLAVSVEEDPVRWPGPVARHAALNLFPTYLPIPRLSRILQRVKENPRTIGDLNYRLPREIEIADLSPDYLDQLRQTLTDLVIDGATWERDKFPHLRTKRPDLMEALVAACRRQGVQGIRTEGRIASSLVAIRLSKEEHSEEHALVKLQRALAELLPDAREAAFWKEDAFLARLHRATDSWHRVFELSRYGGIPIMAEKDAGWVRKRLSDPNEPLDHREMMLWAEMVLLNRSVSHRELLEGLRQFVSDAPNLVAIIDNRLKPTAVSAEMRRFEAQNEKRTKQAERRLAKAHASWVMFWREIERNPDGVFTPTREENTAWNLW
jgi:hypothetical protein